eukprot:ANDGO_03636.mRNA.2 Importin subunit alpha-2
MGTSGEAGQVMYLLEPMQRLLTSSSPLVVELAAWAFGNIAGDSIVLRDQLVEAGILDVFISILTNQKQTHKSVVRTVVWGLTNFIRGQTAPIEKFYGHSTIPGIIVSYLSGVEPEREMLWFGTYYAAKRVDETTQFASLGAFELLLGWVTSSDSSIILPALRFIGNLLLGPDELNEALVSIPHAVDTLLKLLYHDSPAVRKEAAWVISNVAAGRPEQLEVLTTSALFPSLLQAFVAGDYNVRSDLAYALANLCASGYAKNVLVDCGAVEGFVALAKTSVDVGLHNACLAVFDMLCGQVPQGALVAETAGVQDALENLEEHGDGVVARRAVDLLDKYFSNDQQE